MKYYEELTGIILTGHHDDLQLDSDTPPLLQHRSSQQVLQLTKPLRR